MLTFETLLGLYISKNKFKVKLTVDTVLQKNI